MWLGQYLRTHWGLYGLLACFAGAVIWMAGAPRPDPSAPPAPGRRAPAKASATKTTKAPKPEAVLARCRAAGIPAAPAPAPRPARVTHPGFPMPQPAPRVLGPNTRGVLGLRARLNGIAQKQPRHAPLYHRAALGFAERFRFFHHLSTSPAQAEAWHRAQLRRRTAGGATPAGATAPTAAAAPPTAAALAARAVRARRLALAYYQELAENKRLQPYPEQPKVLLEYAGLLLTPGPAAPGREPRRRSAPRHAPARAAETSRSLKLQLLAPRAPVRTARERALAALSQIVQDHPRSPEAVEAAAYLVTTLKGADRCAKLTVLVRQLPERGEAGEAGTPRAWLRAFAHFQAARCLAAGDQPEQALPVLRAVLAGCAKAPADWKPRADALGQEAALLFATTVPDDSPPAEARRRLALAGTAFRAPTGQVVARFLAKGRLRAAAALCEPPQDAPTPRARK